MGVAPRGQTRGAPNVPPRGRATRNALRAGRVCVIMTHMRTATVREAQHNLPKILRSVSRGEVVEITRRNRVVARLVPAAPQPAGGLPDFVARARAIWGRSRRNPTSEIVIEARAERR